MNWLQNTNLPAAAQKSPRLSADDKIIYSGFVVMGKGVSQPVLNEKKERKMLGPKFFLDAIEGLLFGASAGKPQAVASASPQAIREVHGVFHGSGDSGFASVVRISR